MLELCDYIFASVDRVRAPLFYTPSTSDDDSCMVGAQFLLLLSKSKSVSQSLWKIHAYPMHFNRFCILFIFLISKLYF